MKELSHNITCLLANNDCVILPGIGGFIARYECANYLAENEVFVAPRRAVGFNNALTLNDGLLTQAYMQTHGLSYPDASRLLDRELQALQDELTEKGSVTIEGLGMLSRLSDGAYRFDALSCDIVTPELYALPDVNAATVKRAVQAPAAEKHEESLDGGFELVPGNSQGEQSAAEPEESEEALPRSYTISLRRSVVHSVAAAAAAVLIFLCISPPIGNRSNISSASVTSGLMFSAPSVKEPAPAKAPALAARKAAATDAAKLPANSADTMAARPQKPAENVEAQAEEKPFTIVLASDVSKKNAAIFVKQIISQGYPDAEVVNTKTMRRVTYSHYASEQQARKALRTLSRNDFATNAWIMKIK